MTDFTMKQSIQNKLMVIRLLIAWSILLCLTSVSVAQHRRSYDRFSPVKNESLFSERVDEKFLKIFLENSDGKKSQITFGKHNDNCPDWSPDGKQFVFSSVRSGKWKIYKANIDGSNVKCLSSQDVDYFDNTPRWSPDGKKIAFISNRTGKYHIFQMDSNGSNVKQITKGDNEATWPKYSPDGRLAYLLNQGRDFKSTLYDLVIVDKNVTTKLITRKKLHDFAWCKKGEMIAYGVSGSIVFHEFKSKREQKFTLNEINSRLYSHGVTNMRWNPEKRVLVSRLYFRGSLRAGSVVFGDGATLTLSPTGMIKRLDSAPEQ